MINMQKKLLMLAIVFISPKNLYAYMDPGSLNAIWQLLVAILIGLVGTYSFLKIKTKEFFKKLFSNKLKEHFSDDQQADEADYN